MRIVTASRDEKSAISCRDGPETLQREFDPSQWPDYDAARHARTIPAPLFVSRTASLLFLFRSSRIDRPGRLEQGAWIDFWPHGLCGRDGPRRIHGGTCFGQRVDWTARRTH